MAAVVEAVDALPALPPVDPANRYGPRPVTAAWLIDRPANTRRAYYADLARWLGWCHSTGVDPLRARRADADVWKSGLTGARRTVARRLAAVSSWYRYLTSNDAVERNPFAAVTRPKVHRDASPTTGITVDDVAAILDAADDRAARLGSEPALRDTALLRLLLDTGVRVGAMLGARLDSLGYDSGHRILRYVNKGGHPRVAVVPPHAGEALDRYLAARAGRVGVPVEQLAGPVFVSAPYQGRAGDRPLTQRDVWHLLRRTARDAGVTGADQLSPHSCRRAFATHALASGVPLERVQDALGHADPRTTRLYDDNRDRLDLSPTYAVAAAFAARQRKQR